MIQPISRGLQTISSKKNLWPKGWRTETKIMGVINITPDSFSDGGYFIEPIKALERARDCILSGADVIDIGGQSTRPGALIIDADEEISRVIPVLKLLRNEFPDVLISIDTFYSKVADKSLELGADWVNDISGGRHDPEILNVVAKYKSPYVLTHSRGNSITMNNFANYNNVVSEVFKEILINIEKAYSYGVAPQQLIIDPGLGFAKNDIHNFCLLNNLKEFTKTDYPVLVGPSRKKFIGNVLKEPDPKKRIFGTNAVICKCVEANVDIVRVHDVSAVHQTIKIASKLWLRKKF